MNKAAIGTNHEQEEEEVQIKVYKKRWLILFIFSINSMANALLFTSITSVNKIFCRYYNVTPETVDWAANSFSCLFLCIAIPSAYCMTYLGVRALVLIGSSLNAICVCLHLAGTNSDGIWFVMAGQLVGGASVGAVLQVPARLSTVWFPEHEHAKATSIAMVFNVLGLGIGFLQPSYMIPDSENMDEIYNGIYYMNISHMILLAICLLSAYVFFDEKPPLPPSFSMAVTESKQEDHIEVPGLKKSLVILFQDKNFLILTLAYGLYYGLYNYFVTCLNEMASHIITSKEIGWLGFFSNLVAIISILIFSSIVDKYKNYKMLSLILTFGTLVAWTAFSLSLLHWKSTVAVFSTYLVLSLFGVSFFVIGIEYVTELTYPIPEGILCAVILMFGNLVGLSSVLFFGKLVDDGKVSLMCFITIGLYTITFLLVCFVKQNLKRSNEEARHGNNIINVTT